MSGPVLDEISKRLLDAGLIDQVAFAKAAQQQKNLGGSITSNLVKIGAITEEGLLDFLSRLYRAPKADLRSYEIAAAILADLGVRSVALMTNNPDKTKGLEDAGVAVTRRVPHWGAESEHNRGYLEVKRQKLGHET